MSNQDKTVLSDEEIAMQHTKYSAIAAFIQSLSTEGKSVIAILVFSALKEAIQTGEQTSARHNYDLNTKLFDNISKQANAESETPHINQVTALPISKIAKGVDQIFEASLLYHSYSKEGDLIIIHSRVIPSFQTTYNEAREIIGISVNIGVSIIRELNKILDNADGSLEKALQLANQLLSGNQIPNREPKTVTHTDH